MCPGGPPGKSPNDVGASPQVIKKGWLMSHHSSIVKKFYRDFSEEEWEFLEKVMEGMRDVPLEFPAYVVQRMIDRDILDARYISVSNDEIENEDQLMAMPGYQDVVLTFDKGAVYEVSNEGVGKPGNPFRLVIAREDSSGNTYFVKVAPMAEPDSVKVLDVWRRRGKIPIYPPQHSINLFVADWDLVETIDEYLFQDRLTDESLNARAVAVD